MAVDDSSVIFCVNELERKDFRRLEKPIDMKRWVSFVEISPGLDIQYVFEVDESQFFTFGSILSITTSITMNNWKCRSRKFITFLSIVTSWIAIEWEIEKTNKRIICRRSFSWTTPYDCRVRVYAGKIKKKPNNESVTSVSRCIIDFTSFRHY